MQHRKNRAPKRTAKAPFPTYTLAERRLDRAIHGLAILVAIPAVPLLFIAADPWDDSVKLIACLLYSFALLWMLIVSAAYNGIVLHSRSKEVLRRLDHVGVYLLIAGSYTPFALVKIGGAWGTSVFVFVWSLATLGFILVLRFPRSGDRASLGLCLAMGWSVIIIIGPLIQALSIRVLVLLAAGGLLYSVGVAFHLSERMRYHNAVWHAFVVAAVVCHYLAVYEALATPTPLPSLETGAATQVLPADR